MIDRNVILLLILAGVFAQVSLADRPSDRHPVRQDSSLLRALEHLERGAFEAAEVKAFAIATRHEHPLPRAWLVVATARNRAKKYALAAEAYRKYLPYCKDAKLATFLRQKIKRCLSSKRKKPVFRISAPSNKLTDKALAKLAKADKTVTTLTQGRFVVHGRNQLLVELIIAEAKRALKKIQKIIPARDKTSHTIIINVWKNRQEYLANASDAPDWSGGSYRLTTDDDGNVCRRIDLTQLDAEKKFDTRMIDRILPHELTHLVADDYFGSTQCPLFLSEALAMMAENSTNIDRVRLAATTLAGAGAIPLKKLTAMQWHNLKNPEIFYAESYSLLEFLTTHLTDNQRIRVLENVKEGCEFVDAIERALACPPNKEFAKQLESAWMKHAIAQGQFVEAMLQKPRKQ